MNVDSDEAISSALVDMAIADGKSQEEILQALY
jgi:hypothetical protein